MNTLQIPAGYQRVMPYLIVENATDFLDFMQKVFDAKEKQKSLDEQNQIRHAEIQIGESTIMFSNSSAQFPKQNAGMFVYVPNADETFQKAVAAGAAIIMEPADQAYGRSSGVTDPFGNVWWITSPN